MSSVETLVLIAVIVLAIGIGMRLIHLLNAPSATPCRDLPACRTTPVVEPTARMPTGEERPSSDRGQRAGRHGAPTRRLLAHPEGNTPT
ncbi:hypothetical protein ABID95_004231 [Streptomyces atratus]|uniref:hypothetical protein n=1 Tax=Streptomyces atratus TaxID=1893 RepID=UPI0033928B03